jgi:hypothetical protein
MQSVNEIRTENQVEHSGSVEINLETKTTGGQVKQSCCPLKKSQPLIFLSY